MAAVNARVPMCAIRSPSLGLAGMSGIRGVISSLRGAGGAVRIAGRDGSPAAGGHVSGVDALRGLYVRVVVREMRGCEKERERG
jgi:hypothetical protein